MNIVKVRLFRVALSVATTVSVAAVIIFYASGEDRDLDEQATTYHEIQMRAQQACQMTVPDPPDVGFLFRGAATEAARGECRGSVLYGDHVEKILQQDHLVNAISLFLSLVAIFFSAGGAVYLVFGAYRVMSNIWWPWVTGK
jgi:hypothetical protein